MTRYIPTLESGAGSLICDSSLLIFRYPAGDVSTIPAIPYAELVEKDYAWKLAHCLFDERECCEKHFDAVYLPCGYLFDINDEYDKLNVDDNFRELTVGWY